MAINPLPTPPSRGDPANFAQRGDAFMAALAPFAVELEVARVEVVAKEASAVASAETATTKAGEASASAGSALASKNAAELSATSAGTATTQAGIATTKAAEAAASAASVVRDGSGGVAGLTGFALNVWNVAKTFKSLLSFAGTANRSHVLPDKDGTVALVSDITGGTQAVAGTTLSASGAVTVTDSTNGINSGSTAGRMRISGGSASNGACIVLGGSTDGSIPNIGLLQVGANEVARYWVGSFAVTGALSATGAIGSAGTNPYLSVIGMGGAFQAANKFGVDHYAGNARIYSSGPNTSTTGGFEFHSTGSDGSLDTTPMTLDASGSLVNTSSAVSGWAQQVINTASTGNSYCVYSFMPNRVGGYSDILFRGQDNTGVRFNVAGNGNVTNVNNSYGAISDLNLKENIVDCTPKLAGIKQVRIVNFNLKTDPTHKQLGVIAQELELIYPGLIDETPDYIEVTKTREVVKTVAVTVKKEQPTQRTVIEIVDGKAVQTVSTEIALIDVQVFDEYPVFDAAGNTVLELETPEVAEVLDEAGAVLTPFKAAVYRQAIHRVARTQTITEIETYTERELTGTVTKSVKYSVFVPMLIKAMQEQQAIIDAQAVRITALEAK